MSALPTHPEPGAEPHTQGRELLRKVCWMSEWALAWNVGGILSEQNVLMTLTSEDTEQTLRKTMALSL